MPTESLAIAYVSPYPWEAGHPVNVQIARTAEQLAGRGHRVIVAGPSTDVKRVRADRAAIRAGGLTLDEGPFRFLAIGEALGRPGGTQASARSRATLPVDVSKTVEALMGDVALDVCHVHEPYAPSVASVALRHSRALNAGTFHAPVERVSSTQVARKLVDLVFGRLDARLASFEATAQLLRRSFPADYEVVEPGADVVAAAARDGEGPVRVLFVEGEERGARRTFLRALRRLAPDVGWEAVVVSDRGPLPGDLGDRVRFGAQAAADAELAQADVVVLASDGALPAPDVALRAIAAGAVPLCSALDVYEEVIAEGAEGLLFPPGDPATLAEQLRRLVADTSLRHRLRDAGTAHRERLAWSRLADETERVYTRMVARRHDLTGVPALRAALADRPRIDVDLHMHTDHSGDCATPVEVLLATAREQGFGAIAITDHNEVSGAFEAAAKAAEFGVKVIVAEEVKTAAQGEVIGLFLKEKIPRGLTLEQTVAEIKRQGGLVYVPHPFDRMHSVPDYEHLLSIVDDIDAIEIYNPRVAIGSFNEEAERFAAKYRIVAGAGSDSHVAQGLGSVRIRMADFDGPQEFLESLRTAEIHTKPSSLLYVQALKFLETKATPAGAREAIRERRVRRATRKA